MNDSRMRIPLRRFLAALSLLVALTAMAFTGQKHKGQEPKSQVVPLPPELPKALIADTASLDFHVSPPLRTGHLSVQVRQSLADLIRDTRGETIVKLRAFVAGTGDARTVQSEATQIFREHKLPLPALSILTVGALSTPAAQVIVQAIVDTGKHLNPNGLAFASGQRGATLIQSLDRLADSLKAANVSPDGVLSLTCFSAQLTDPASLQSQIQARFPGVPSTLLQAVRDPLDEATICEAIGRPAAAMTEGSPLQLLEKSRVAIVGTPQLIFTGLQLSFGNYLNDAEEAVARLQRNGSALSAVASPVQVDVFCYDLASGAAIRKRTTVPLSTLTVQTVESLPGADATAGIEAVLAPGVSSPVIVPR